MKSHNRLGLWMSRFAIIGIVLLGLAGLYAPAVASATGTPTIISDLADYAPGATVTLTGAGVRPRRKGNPATRLRPMTI